MIYGTKGRYPFIRPIIYVSHFLTLKVALAVGKKVMLMMMRATTTIASDTTITCSLGSGLGCGSWSKNSRSHFKLILCCFLPNSFHIPYSSESGKKT